MSSAQPNILSTSELAYDRHVNQINDFTDIYQAYCLKLQRFASDLLGCTADAENIVHDVFADLLTAGIEKIQEISNLNAYLFRLTRNRCLDSLRHLAHVEQHAAERAIEYRQRLNAVESWADVPAHFHDLQHAVAAAMEALPPRCREIFRLSREQGKSYGEIAATLQISEKTVSAQMGIALKKLRLSLSEYIS